MYKIIIAKEKNIGEEINILFGMAYNE